MFDIKNVEIDAHGDIIKAQIIDNEGYIWHYDREADRGLYIKLSPDESVEDNGYYVEDFTQALFILSWGGYI